MTSPSAGDRIAGLDGIRALAVLLVILIHLGFAGCGWIGVQIFFVLSGFLITRILLNMKESRRAGRYFGEFYLRRSLRIFPAYFAYLLLLAAGAYLLDPDLWSRLRNMLPFLASYTFNYGLLIEEPVRSMWVAHLWSLSVEEQFYLLWPLLLWFTPRHRVAQLIAVTVLAGPLLRLALYLWAQSLESAAISPANIVYVFTLSHMDAFAMGAALCFPQVRDLAVKLGNGWFLALAVLACLLGIGSSGVAILPSIQHGWPLTLGFPVMLPGQGQWLWGYSAINLLAALLIAKVAYAGFGRGLFQHPAMDAFGRVSYGIYLIHHGIILWFVPLTPWLMRVTGLPSLTVTALWTPFYVLLVYGLAWFSFRYFEAPLLRFKDRLSPPPVSSGGDSMALRQNR